MKPRDEFLRAATCRIERAKADARALIAMARASREEREAREATKRPILDAYDRLSRSGS